MAKLEVSFPYKTLTKKAAFGYGILWALFGVIIVPLLTAALHAVAAGGAVPHALMGILELVLVLGSAVLYTFVPFRLVTLCMQGGRFVANEDGLGSPVGVFGKAPWMAWEHLRLAEMQNDTIKLTFEPHQVVQIQTKKIAAADLEQLLIALEVWGHEAILADSLIELRDQLQNKKVGIEDHAYTQLWEEELSRRFNSTTFVPLEPGQKLRSNEFTVIKQLAFGGFSAVYLAENRAGDNVVIKESVSNADDDVSNKALEFFKREALFLGKLRHDRIAQVLDSFVENRRSYLVLQHIPGENLRQYVRNNGPLSEPQVLKIMIDLADVLAYLHEQTPPILHRDLTPDNLVMQADGTVIVIDFGAANEYIGTATGTLIGKQCYMPPEQVRGKSDPTTDLYALGCTACFLLTGQDPEALMICRPRNRNSAISAETDQLIADLTMQDNKKRIQTAEEIRTRITNLQPKQISNNLASKSL